MRLALAPPRTAFSDGSHCAFTDLARFRSHIYLAFRSSPVGHSVDPSGEIVCLRSADDGKSWEPGCRFALPGSRDPRDPHFLVFGDKLFIYTGAWLCGSAPAPSAAAVDSMGNIDGGLSIDINDMVGYAVWTEDGSSFSPPAQLEGTQGHYIWRVAAQQGTAFMSARRRRDFVPGVAESPAADIECVLLTSSDGLRWGVAGMFAEEHGDETAFLLEPDGSILGLVRGAPDETTPGAEGSRVVRSEWPYREWSRENTGVYVGGPLLFEWAGRYIVGGRHRGLGTRETTPSTTFLWELDVDVAELKPLLELPSSGDCSYPGFVKLSREVGLVSWYSGDAAGECIIRVAEVTMQGVASL